MGYVNGFVESKPSKNSLKNIILHVGQGTIEGSREYSSAPSATSETLIDLLKGAKILEEHVGMFRLTKERGREVYELLKKEEESAPHGSDEGST